MNPNLQDFLRYAEHFMGVPYIWGGHYPGTGFDCSGFICEVLRSIGLVGDQEHLTALNLYDRFAVKSLFNAPPVAGDLIFYGRSADAIRHVALVTSPYTIIECGGGDQSTTSISLASSIGACVRKRGINHRADRFAAVRPRYPWD